MPSAPRYRLLDIFVYATVTSSLSIPQGPGMILLPAGGQSQSIAPQLNSSSPNAGPILALNISEYLSASTLTNEQAEIHCDETRFGNPRVESCRTALLQVPIVFGDPTYSFGPRGEGHFDIGLPKRYISSKTSPVN